MFKIKLNTYKIFILLFMSSSLNAVNITFIPSGTINAEIADTCTLFEKFVDNANQLLEIKKIKKSMNINITLSIPKNLEIKSILVFGGGETTEYYNYVKSVLSDYGQNIYNIYLSIDKHSFYIVKTNLFRKTIRTSYKDNKDLEIQEEGMLIKLYDIDYLTRNIETSKLNCPMLSKAPECKYYDPYIGALIQSDTLIPSAAYKGNKDKYYKDK